ncbi:hypothetical protein CTAYLR_000773 [Chrysophaeum taylorii]|uniref:SAGA-associated factor 11 n=1 Tax=Chrysophaeum taylorii TaxID=2483200 RepID=A0AAD7URK8_9STRA|nr:hypothetical protein CTAYLR_000773 [Chrysophaeum taylorii]
MAPDDEDVDALIARCLIHDCILDVVFDLIRSIKSSDAPIHELCAPPRRQPDIETRNGHPPTSKETPKEGGALFESLAPFREPKGEFRCAHCGQKVSALRYAPHLDKCMGKGRGRRLAATTRKS